MGEQDPDSIKRAALLRRIGITGVAALTGVAAVEGTADATQHPFNLDISEGGQIDTVEKAHHPATTSTPIQVENVQIIGSLSNLKVPTGWSYQIFQVASPYIEGTDENGGDHGADAGGYRKLAADFYVVVSRPTALTCQ
jgi:hypothetical protein